MDVLAGGFANHIQLALQRVLYDHIIATTDEDLLQNWLFFAHGRRHRHVAIDRHITPAQQHLALSLDRTFHLLLASQARCVLFRQKDHANAVFAGCRQGHTLLGHLFTVQRVGQLNQNTRAVTHQLISTHRAPMVQILQDLQSVFDDVVGFLALDMRHKAHAASIMLLATGVQAVLGQMSNLLSMGQWNSWNQVRHSAVLGQQIRLGY